MRMKKTFAACLMIWFFAAGICTMSWAAEMVNINTATEDELMKLDKIGPAKAAEIVKYRNENGPFTSIEDLKKVKGIGDATFEVNKDRIIADVPKTQETVTKSVKEQAADAVKKTTATVDSSVSPVAADIKAGQEKAASAVKKTQTGLESSIPPAVPAVTDTKKK